MSGTNLIEDLIKLGKECAVNITGDPSDAESIITPSQGFAAIKAELELGRKLNHELKNKLYNEHQDPLQ